MTIRRVAERLGIRVPSLYKHLPNKEAIEMQLVALGFEEAAEAFQAAVAGSTPPLADFASAYRNFALEHPHLYRLPTIVRSGGTYCQQASRRAS